MSNLVRVKRHPVTGRSFTTSKAYADRHNLDYTTEGATDAHGRVAPAGKPRTTLAGKPINASMSREDLEAAALAAGIDEGTVAAAKNKGQLVAAINDHQEPDADEAGDSDDLTTEA